MTDQQKIYRAEEKRERRRLRWAHLGEPREVPGKPWLVKQLGLGGITEKRSCRPSYGTGKPERGFNK